MKKYGIIYNMGKTAGMVRQNLSIKDVYALISKKELIYIGTMIGSDIEEIFENCNINHPEWLIKKVEELKSADYIGIHTSMSVGDFVYDAEKNIFWQVLPVGWLSIK